MVSIKIDDKITCALRKEWVEQNPFDTDKKITHIVKEILIEKINELKIENGKKETVN